MIGFGMLFQLPLVLIFINKIHKLEVRSLMDFERWVILISFILAAILTPTPDVVNQLVMAVPIILLYQISVLVIWFINRRNAVDPTKVIPT
jgi:sec-independent protein translocase protein TatC